MPVLHTYFNMIRYFLKIEDFTGSGEIPLFGQDYIEYSKYGKIGMYLLITARVEKI